MKRVAIAYALVLFGLILAADFGFLREVGELVNNHPPLDKILHFTMYGLLALVVNWTLLLQGWSRWQAFAIGSVAVMTVSTVEEYTNIFVPLRGWSLGDLAANYLGILGLGSLPMWCLNRAPSEQTDAKDRAA